MTLTTDIYENTSEDLSDIIQKVLNDEEVAQPATLASVREEVLKDIKTITIPLNSFSDERLQELRNEVDALIDEYGGDALAIRFFKPRASQALSRLIEVGLNELGETSLSQLFDALERGMLAKLIAEGEVDDDEAQTVTAELQALIEKHGSKAIAEDFLR